MRHQGHVGSANATFSFRNGSSRRLAFAAPLVAVLVAVAMAVAFAAGWAPHSTDPGARAGIETTSTIMALVVCGLLLGQFRRHRRRDDLLLLSVLTGVTVSDFVFFGLPLLVNGARIGFGDAPRMIASLLVPVGFLLAAFAKGTIVPSGRLVAPLIGSFSVVTIALAGVLELAIGGSGRASYELTRALNAADAALFVGAGLVFLTRSGLAAERSRLLGAAVFLFAAARLQAISMSVVPADWLTARELLRVIAYATVLAGVAAEYRRIWRADAADAVIAQRERLARDIHDGLAQDLAVISLHAPWIEAALGAEHAVSVAARRALAASRTAIVDLSAASAPSTEAALREVADELEARFGATIAVTCDDHLWDGRDLPPQKREQAVRIAREAIVNAASHGGAAHIEVVLRRTSARCLLTVSDDGSGFDPGALETSTGFGLRAMQNRAAEIGGRLAARRRPAGGSVLELSLAVPSSRPRSPSSRRRRRRSPAGT